MSQCLLRRLQSSMHSQLEIRPERSTCALNIVHSLLLNHPGIVHLNERRWWKSLIARARRSGSSGHTVVTVSQDRLLARGKVYYDFSTESGYVLYSI